MKKTKAKKSRHENFENFGNSNDRALRKSVTEKACVRGEQNRWNDEHGTRRRDEERATFACAITLRYGKLGVKTKNVIV